MIRSSVLILGFPLVLFPSIFPSTVRQLFSIVRFPYLESGLTNKTVYSCNAEFIVRFLDINFRKIM